MERFIKRMRLPRYRLLIDMLLVTDPPYYDNIQYAELSDFFYVWLRPLLRDSYPELFAGMITPKGRRNSRRSPV